MVPLVAVNGNAWTATFEYVDVNQSRSQHVRFPKVFSLGDVCSTPNSKTAAAVRKQAPVVANEIISAVAGKLLPGAYDGYASCPLTTALGKTILAEFIYGGKVTPTLPLLSPAKERWGGWWIKVTGLPLMYWHYMLKGYVWFPKHNTEFKEEGAA
jgi:sulfide:quinone oxidoreductase